MTAARIGRGRAARELAARERREVDRDPETVPVAEWEAEPVGQRRQELELLSRVHAERAREEAADDGHRRDGRERERDAADDPGSRDEPRDHDRDCEHRDVERDLVELGKGALGVGSPAGRNQDPDGEGGEQAERDEREPVDARSRRRDADRGARSQDPPGRETRVGTCRRGKAAVRIRESENDPRDAYSHRRTA
jgi:hypothetical protein